MAAYQNLPAWLKAAMNQVEASGEWADIRGKLAKCVDKQRLNMWPSLSADRQLEFVEDLNHILQATHSTPVADFSTRVDGCVRERLEGEMFSSEPPLGKIIGGLESLVRIHPALSNSLGGFMHPMPTGMRRTVWGFLLGESKYQSASDSGMDLLGSEMANKVHEVVDKNKVELPLKASQLRGLKFVVVRACQDLMYNKVDSLVRAAYPLVTVFVDMCDKNDVVNLQTMFSKYLMLMQRDTGWGNPHMEYEDARGGIKNLIGWLEQYDPTLTRWLRRITQSNPNQRAFEDTMFALVEPMVTRVFVGYLRPEIVLYILDMCLLQRSFKITIRAAAIVLRSIRLDLLRLETPETLGQIVKTGAQRLLLDTFTEDFAAV